MAVRDAPLQRIRAEFTELPGLKLTVAQARRLWAATAADCLAALQALTAECPHRRHLNAVGIETSGATAIAGTTFRASPAAGSSA